jgi:hypothetical protein
MWMPCIGALFSFVWKRGGSAARRLMQAVRSNFSYELDVIFMLLLRTTPSTPALTDSLGFALRDQIGGYHFKSRS